MDVSKYDEVWQNLSDLLSEVGTPCSMEVACVEMMLWWTVSDDDVRFGV
jgi:hypothetical protein